MKTTTFLLIIAVLYIPFGCAATKADDTKNSPITDHKEIDQYIRKAQIHADLSSEYNTWMNSPQIQQKIQAQVKADKEWAEFLDTLRKAHNAGPQCQVIVNKDEKATGLLTWQCPPDPPAAPAAQK